MGIALLGLGQALRPMPLTFNNSWNDSSPPCLASLPLCAAKRPCQTMPNEPEFVHYIDRAQGVVYSVLYLVRPSRSRIRLQKLFRWHFRRTFELVLTTGGLPLISHCRLSPTRFNGNPQLAHGTNFKRSSRRVRGLPVGCDPPSILLDCRLLGAPPGHLPHAFFFSLRPSSDSDTQPLSRHLCQGGAFMQGKAIASRMEAN